ncbi:MAG: UDP-3-O-acyl-N-acetylglucosamine deacetylase, partial [Candidatus Sericytochromatia bacterium]|nr:UDP-3-O-acyl-N-acetylglucosamine deacetylase [Candidatus Sericytochromatia bacterium]
MNLNYQKQFTISEKISFSGVGVHSGIESKITLAPANTKSGIKFIKENHIIDLDINNIEKSFLCTKITNNKVSIFTIEHLLSALYGLGINNINIFVQGEEIPILDGSAKIFVHKIKEKIIVQDINREFLELNQAIYIRE